MTTSETTTSVQHVPQSHEPVPEDVYGSWSASPSPDGEHVAFVSDRSGVPRVWIRPVASGHPVPVPALLDRVSTVSWSPDGQWLACVTAAAGASRTQIWAVRPDGHDLHLVAGAGTATAVLGGGPWRGWSADGRLLVTETTGEESQAVLVEPGTGGRELLAAGRLLTLLD